MGEENKEQAEKCRDIGAAALRDGDYERAVKFLQKSLQLHALPGVEALLGHAQAKQQQQQQQTNGSSSSNGGGSERRTPRTNAEESSNQNHFKNSNSSSSSSHARRASSSPAASSASPTNSPSRASSAPAPPPARSNSTASDGRSYTEEQVAIVKQVLKSKQSGRGAHYRVLGLSSEHCTEAEIKKAYRKLSLKVHPDKNAAPHADEAFKAVGLAYATLSDPQKRTIYDRYGDEDPDNRGGGVGNPFAGRGGGGMHRGQEVSPEEIFNMFFGGGGMAGGPGFHVYSTGFGPGMHFRTAGGGAGGPGGMPRARRAGQQQPHQNQHGAAEEISGIGLLFQLLPVLLIMLVSFMRMGDDGGMSQTTMPGERKFFSLTPSPPFLHPLSTKLTPVKDIPFYVTDSFLRTYARDRYQRGQVERMVERAYENYLWKECSAQQTYKQSLVKAAERERTDHAEYTRKLKSANEFSLTRCIELDDLFPHHPQRKEQRNREERMKQKAATATKSS